MKSPKKSAKTKSAVDAEEKTGAAPALAKHSKDAVKPKAAGKSGAGKKAAAAKKPAAAKKAAAVAKKAPAASKSGKAIAAKPLKAGATRNTAGKPGKTTKPKTAGKKAGTKWSPVEQAGIGETPGSRNAGPPLAAASNASEPATTTKVAQGMVGAVVVAASGLAAAAGSVLGRRKPRDKG